MSFGRFGHLRHCSSAHFHSLAPISAKGNQTANDLTWIYYFHPACMTLSTIQVPTFVYSSCKRTYSIVSLYDLRPDPWWSCALTYPRTMMAQLPHGWNHINREGRSSWSASIYPHLRTTISFDFIGEGGGECWWTSNIYSALVPERWLLAKGPFDPGFPSAKTPRPNRKKHLQRLWMSTFVPGMPRPLDVHGRWEYPEAMNFPAPKQCANDFKKAEMRKLQRATLSFFFLVFASGQESNLKHNSCIIILRQV